MGTISQTNSPAGESSDEEPTCQELTLEVARLRAELEEARQHGPHRRRLPDTRESITHKFCVAGHEGYITVGLYEDGSPGEVFLTMAKQGSTLRGLMDTAAVLTSLCLQSNIAVEILARKFEHSHYEPNGHTTNPEMRIASSITDYVFRWLGLTFSDTYRDECAARAFDDNTAELPHGPQQ